jgi:hypothetical protein
VSDSALRSEAATSVGSEGGIDSIQQSPKYVMSPSYPPVTKSRWPSGSQFVVK